MREQLFTNPDLARFYDADVDTDIPRWDEDFCLGLAQNAKSVLDLGCGTGTFCLRVMQGRRVFGIDPAKGMLDIAKAKRGAEQIQWVLADACTMRLSEKFDLIVMLGHAFQCLLTDQSQLQLFETIAAHLAVGGTFVIDSRNTKLEAWRDWTPDKTRKSLAVEGLGEVSTWHDVKYDQTTNIATYDTNYVAQSTGQQWHASSRIRFGRQDEIAARIAEAGLKVSRWMGDWHGRPLAETAPEIIPVGGWG